MAKLPTSADAAEAFAATTVFARWVPELVLCGFGGGAEPVDDATARATFVLWQRLLPRLAESRVDHPRCAVALADHQVQAAWQRACLRLPATAAPPRLRAHETAAIDAFRRDAAATPFDLADYVHLPAAVHDFVASLRDYVAGGTGHNLLLYGPPGSGKTCLAYAFGKAAAARGVPFFEVNAVGLLSGVYAASAQTIDRVFSQAALTAPPGRPVLVFFDEVDAVLRHDATGDLESQRIRAAMLEALGECRCNVFVVTATNNLAWIDTGAQALMGATVHLDVPGVDDLRQVLRHYLDGGDTRILASHDTLRPLAEQAVGLDRRAVAQAVQRAAIRAHVRAVSGGHGPAAELVTFEDVATSLSEAHARRAATAEAARAPPASSR